MRCSFLPSRPAVPLAVAGLVLTAGAAAAHTAERGLVMLLPTDYYLAGGAAAVAVSFAVLALAPAPTTSPRPAAEAEAPARAPPPIWLGWLGTAFLAMLIAAGFLGSRDPLLNPLALGVWTAFWVGMTLLQALVGDLWRMVEPWRAPLALLARLRGTGRPPLRLPVAIGHAPAIAQFAGFAWFELVDPAPDDPARLATAVALYWLVNAGAMALFGAEEWRRRGECFSVFLGFIALLSPIRWRPYPRLSWPGARILAAPAPSRSAAGFILLALATVSFDGLSRTFVYLDWIGVNPLEFPGRTAVMAENTVGLLLAALALGGAFFAVVALGRRLAGRAAIDAPALVLTLLPISLAYHFSHYLPLLLVNAQYIAKAVGDPFGIGANWFGLSDIRVTASFLNDYHSVETIWNLQAGAIVIGHVWAVWLAHAIAASAVPGRARAALAEAPLAALMVGYTVFGLWLLSAPTGA